LVLRKNNAIVALAKRKRDPAEIEGEKEKHGLLEWATNPAVLGAQTVSRNY